MLVPCSVCGELVRRYGKKLTTIKHIYCSKKCISIATRKREVRYCLNCHKPFEVKKCLIKLGAGKLCSMDCRKKYFAENKKTRKEIWGKYNQKPTTKVKKRIWHEQKIYGSNKTLIDGGECALCGKTTDLVIHHNDGNNGKMGKSLNNDPSNLVILCRSCHPKVHYRGELRMEVVSSANK